MRQFAVSLYKWQRHISRHRDTLELGRVNVDLEFTDGTAVTGMWFYLIKTPAGFEVARGPSFFRMTKEYAAEIGRQVADAISAKYGPMAIAEEKLPVIEKPRAGMEVTFDHEILGPLHGKITDVRTDEWKKTVVEIYVDAKRGTLPRRTFLADPCDVRRYAPSTVPALTGTVVPLLAGH